MCCLVEWHMQMYPANFIMWDPQSHGATWGQFTWVPHYFVPRQIVGPMWAGPLSGLSIRVVQFVQLFFLTHGLTTRMYFLDADYNELTQINIF